MVPHKRNTAQHRPALHVIADVDHAESMEPCSLGVEIGSRLLYSIFKSGWTHPGNVVFLKTSI
jgi:hypothetical protein